MSYIVYKHTAPNGKVYIGITRRNPIKRWQNGNGYRHNPHFFTAILLYGWNNIKHEILFSGLTEKEAWEKEKTLIKKYDSTNREKGYNIENGGNTIGKHGAETIQKIKEKHHSVKGANNPMWGKPRNDLQAYNIEAKSKKVNQYSLDGAFVASYRSTKEAFRQTGIRHIHECCNGSRSTAGGYVWKYAE